MRKESVGATMKHPGRKITHDRLCLDMQVAEHFIRPPTTNEANAVRVDLGAQEGHGTRRSEGAR